MSDIKITKERIDALLGEADIRTLTLFGKCTVVTAKLKNGFVLTADSACVDPANYDKRMGERICLEHIANKLWELEGYRLQWDVFNKANRKGTAPGLDDETLDEMRAMNDHATNKGGWKDSAMRKWLNEDVLPRLPKELQAMIVPRTIRQKINGEEVQTQDKLWLPSFTEMFGADAAAEWAPGDLGDEQFELFDSERSRVKEVPGRGTWWYWLRSPYASLSTYFCLVYSNGDADIYFASIALGVAFGFCL